jgi:hypothetical protein
MTRFLTPRRNILALGSACRNYGSFAATLATQLLGESDEFKRLRLEPDMSF